MSEDKGSFGSTDLNKEESIMFGFSKSKEKNSENERKIEKLYEKYNRLMYVVVYNILKNHEDSEDVVIESWEKIIRHLDKIGEIDCQETKSFIVIITERTAIDFYRKRKKRDNIRVLTDEYEMSPYFVTKDKALDNIELHQIMENIPKKYSEVLILYYVNGFSGKEIADLLGIKEAAVMARLSRGRKHLRKELENND